MPMATEAWYWGEVAREKTGNYRYRIERRRSGDLVVLELEELVTTERMFTHARSYDRRWRDARPADFLPEPSTLNALVAFS